MAKKKRASKAKKKLQLICGVPAMPADDFESMLVEISDHLGPAEEMRLARLPSGPIWTADDGAQINELVRRLGHENLEFLLHRLSPEPTQDFGVFSLWANFTYGRWLEFILSRACSAGRKSRWKWVLRDKKTGRWLLTDQVEINDETQCKRTECGCHGCKQGKTYGYCPYQPDATVCQACDKRYERRCYVESWATVVKSVADAVARKDPR